MDTGLTVFPIAGSITRSYKSGNSLSEQDYGPYLAVLLFILKRCRPAHRHPPRGGVSYARRGTVGVAGKLHAPTIAAYPATVGVLRGGGFTRARKCSTGSARPVNRARPSWLWVVHVALKCSSCSNSIGGRRFIGRGATVLHNGGYASSCKDRLIALRKVTGLMKHACWLLPR